MSSPSLLKFILDRIRKGLLHLTLGLSVGRLPFLERYVYLGKFQGSIEPSKEEIRETSGARKFRVCSLQIPIQEMLCAIHE